MTHTPPRITFAVQRQRVSGVIQAHRRRRAYIRRQVSPEERRRRREATHQNTAALYTAIEEWFQLTMSTAQELGKHFNHRQHWILDKMFYRGAQVKKKSKTNAWNAWASKTYETVNVGKYLVPFSPLSIEAHIHSRT
jgi:hypothetical protein